MIPVDKDVIPGCEWLAEEYPLILGYKVVYDWNNSPHEVPIYQKTEYPADAPDEEPLTDGLVEIGTLTPDVPTIQ